MSALTDLTDEVRVVLTLAEKAFTKLEEIGDDDERRHYLDLLGTALELKRLTADLHRVAEDLLVANMGNERRATIDGTTVEVRRSYKRSEWEHAKLATHVALRATGGELVEGMDLVVDAFIRAARPEWRIGVLKEMGLDDADYSARELGRATVQLL